MSPENSNEEPFVFPKWVDHLPLVVLLSLAVIGSVVIFVFWYWFSPKSLEIGYMPEQPIPYSHRLHVGELGMDCRYCHVNVEKGPKATIPPTEICMNCHKSIKKNSPHIKKLAKSFNENKPIEWVQVHKVPDYVYFDHSRHVNVGVSCVSCHGRVDKMNVVHQVESLSMSWCLDCHRHPEKALRPVEFVMDLGWKVDNQEEMGAELKKKKNVLTREDCSSCHR